MHCTSFRTALPSAYPSQRACRQLNLLWANFLIRWAEGACDHLLNAAALPSEVGESKRENQKKLGSGSQNRDQGLFCALSIVKTDP